MKLSTVFTAMTIVGFLGSAAFAEEAAKTAAAPAAKTDAKAAVTAAKADLKEVETMVTECMAGQKDAKAHGECMKKCEASAGKEECTKVMSHMGHGEKGKTHKH